MIPAEQLIEMFRDIKERKARKMPDRAPPYIPMKQAGKA